MFKALIRKIKTTEVYKYFKFKWQHARDCFTSVKPSENNMYFQPRKRGPQYQCMDCDLIFTINYQPFVLEKEDGSCSYSISNVPPQCPCGSRSYFPLDKAIPCRRNIERISKNSI